MITVLAQGPIDKTMTALAEILIKLGTEGVMAYLSVQFPFLNTPILKSIVRYIVNKIISLAIMQTELGTYFLIIDWKTSKEARDFEKVALEHDEALKKGNADEIKKLEQAKIDAARKLIRIKPY